MLSVVLLWLAAAPCWAVLPDVSAESNPRRAATEGNDDPVGGAETSAGSLDIAGADRLGEAGYDLNCRFLSRSRTPRLLCTDRRLSASCRSQLSSLT
jgi:hypothetical protein